MDPLSVTASIIALLQLTQSLATYVNSFKNASKEQKRVAIEASSLYSLLTALRFRVEEARSSDPWFNQVKLLNVENGPLTQLQQLLEQLLQKISNDPSSAHSPSISSVSKIIDHSRSKLMWHFDKQDVAELLNRIERLKTLINLALVNDLTTLAQEINRGVTDIIKQTEQIEIGVNHIQRSISDTLKNKLSGWLGVPDPSTNYRAALEKRQAKTGLWLTKGATFEKWKSSTASSMWLHGKPGCGKTILSSTALEDLLESADSSPDMYVSYFFFDFGEVEKQSWKRAIRSLLLQFCYQLPNILKALEELYRSCQDGTQQPADDRISALLQDCVVCPGNKFILLDALDECTDRNSLLDFLEETVQKKNSHLHLFVASRREKDIQDYLDEVIDYQIDVQSAVIEDDICSYIHERLENDRRLKKWKAPVKDEIALKLMEKADGMFRWVQCQLDSLQKCGSVGDLRRALLSLPKTLDETYERIVQHIDSSDQLERAVWILQWLCFSARPMFLPELNEVLAISSGDEKKFDSDERFEDPYDIMGVCSGLIGCTQITLSQREYDTLQKLDDNRGNFQTQVRLAHYSVKEYLLSDRSSLQSCFRPSRGHEQILGGCLAYLLHVCQTTPLVEAPLPQSFSDYVPPNRIDLALTVIKEHPLAIYATQNWPFHAREVEGQHCGATWDAVANFVLDGQRSTTLWQQLLAASENMPILGDNLAYRFEYGSPPVLFLSALGLVDLLSHVISSGANIEARTAFGGSTPLIEASRYGRKAAVKLLLDKGADIRARDAYGYTALSMASDVGHEKIVELLLDKGSDIEARNHDDQTALCIAAFRGDVKVARLLLDRGADANVTYRALFSLLEFIILAGNLDMAELLLDKGADVERRVESGQTMLMKMSFWGFEESVELLIRRGANVNAQDYKGNTALSMARKKGNEEIARILKSHGAIE